MNQLSILPQKLMARCPNMTILHQAPMTKRTSFRIGGPATLMVIPNSMEELVATVQEAYALELESFYIGNGSNLLVSDQGVDCLVIKLGGGLSQVSCEGNTITAQGGILLSQLANYALECGLTGLEFAHGIPGTLGGGITMNAGAYGGELCQVITEVTCLTTEGELQVLSTEDCQFTYRHSAFSDGGRAIVKAKFQLQPGNPEEIHNRMDDLMNKRREKQPLEYPSGGSTFKRPEGYFASALIESAGLKGYTIGGAQVSQKHSGFCINYGNATCEDMDALMAHVQKVVLEETGVSLEPELKRVGP